MSVKDDEEFKFCYRDSVTSSAESSSFAHSDLSALQLLAGDWEAAERSARRALQLSGGNDWARFVLGAALVVNPVTYSEGLQHLEYASRSVPAARDALKALQAK